MSNFILQDSASRDKATQHKAFQKRALKNVSKVDVQKQEINFYKKQVKISRLPLSAIQALVIIIVSCTILFLYTSLINANLLELKEKNNQLTIFLNDLNESANQPVKDEIRKNALSKTLQINELREAIAIKQAVEKFYHQYQLKNKLSAYQIIEDINASTPRGMTIFEVDAYNGGTQMTINGTVEEAIAATVFLKQLRSHDRYHETDFGYLSIKNIEGESSYNFALFDNKLIRRAPR
jgi:hypothetical protein